MATELRTDRQYEIRGERSRGRALGVRRSFYRPELDILRFCAFLAVFVAHGAEYPKDFYLQHYFPNWAAVAFHSIPIAGIYGVDLFFVLSAYLITELLLREKESIGSLDVRAFYLRRILRIWPLYYLFVATAALIPFLNPHGQFGARYVIPLFLLVGNWSFVLFGIPQSAAVPLWSVSVEEQFYLLWPPLIARMSRRQLVTAAVAMIFMANLSRTVAVAMSFNRAQLWMNTFAHLDSIAAGILIAIVVRGKRPFVTGLLRLAVIGFAVCCLAARGLFDTEDPKARLNAAATLIGDPVVVLACAAILIAFIGSSFRSAALEYLGKISYGLYVYHMASIWFFNRYMPGGNRGPAYAIARLLSALAFTVVMSALSYHFLEKPFLTLKRRFEYIKSRPV